MLENEKQELRKAINIISDMASCDHLICSVCINQLEKLQQLLFQIIKEKK